MSKKQFCHICIHNKIIYVFFLIVLTLAPAAVWGNGWLSPVKITNNIFSDEVASISYDGTKIAFYSDADGDYDIYFCEYTAGSWTAPVNLSNNSLSDTMPEINADGTGIAFLGGSEENRDIFFVEYSSGTWQEPVMLTNSLDGEYFPSINADSSRITYQTKDSSGNRYIMLVEKISGVWQAPVALPTVTDNNMFPVINADGTRIAFYGVNEEGYRDIYFVEYSGETWQGPINLTDNSENDCQPSINDDGGKIVYYWTGESFLPHVLPGATADVRLLEFRDGLWYPPVTIAGGPYYEFDPTIDADGNRITYVESVPGVGEHIYVTEYSNGSWRIPENLTGGVVSGYRPNISGDGNTIVFYGTGLVDGVMDLDYEIYVLRYAESLGSITGRVTELTNPETFLEDVLIRATPGGFMTKTDSEGSYILKVPPGTYTVTALKNCLNPESTAGITIPNGGNATVAFSLGTGGSNCAPKEPETPSPASGSTDQPLDLTVTWQCDDPDTGDTLTYDVYLGVMTLHHIEQHIVSGDQTEKSCTITGLNPDMRYYWQVVARDSQGYETAGPRWNFTTVKASQTTLSTFRAMARPGKVRLRWSTESENNNTGFNLYRSESENGEYVKINDGLIPSKGSLEQGATYTFTDNNVRNRKTYWYKIEDIDINGAATLHGPASATPRLLYWLGE